MPFYDLKCANCGKEFNVMATITEKTEKRIPCPDCGSHELTRVYEKMNLSVGNAEVSAPVSQGCSCCAHASGCPHAQKVEY